MITPVFLILMQFTVPQGCKQPEIQTVGKLKWLKQDTDMLQANGNFCTRKFKESYCIKSVTKRGERMYHIQCSRPEEQ